MLPYSLKPVTSPISESLISETGSKPNQKFIANIKALSIVPSKVMTEMLEASAQRMFYGKEDDNGRTKSFQTAAGVSNIHICIVIFSNQDDAEADVIMPAFFKPKSWWHFHSKNAADICRLANAWILSWKFEFWTVTSSSQMPLLYSRWYRTRR